MNLAITLDESTERRQRQAVHALDAIRGARLTRAEAARLFGPIQRSEESAAVRLSTSTFPQACLGSA